MTPTLSYGTLPLWDFKDFGKHVTRRPKFSSFRIFSYLWCFCFRIAEERFLGFSPPSLFQTPPCSPSTSISSNHSSIPITIIMIAQVVRSLECANHSVKAVFPLQFFSCVPLGVLFCFYISHTRPSSSYICPAFQPFLSNFALLFSPLFQNSYAMGYLSVFRRTYTLSLQFFLGVNSTDQFE